MQKTFSKRNWWILIVFGLIGQIAWSVENMYFNVFIYETITTKLSYIKLMVQLSGIAATVTTLIAGTLSDKTGNRRSYISYGYLIWGFTVALFGLIDVKGFETLFAMEHARAIALAIALVVIGDCVMTMFGSTANDAAFNAWVTDNTKEEFRGKVEGVLAILPLVAMLIVAGGFGMLAEGIGYKALFLGLGAVITICGIVGIFTVKDSPNLQRNGSFKDIIYGFKPSVVKANKPLYLTLILVGIYGVACQCFMPYLIIYMTEFLGLETIEYSIIFGGAIAIGAIINVFLGALSDMFDKARLLYTALGIMAVGLTGMFFFHFDDKMTTMITFGIAGFVMITGYIFTSALCGALTRDYTPVENAGKLQGVRMIFSVLIPMVIGPEIGNAINKAAGIPLLNAGVNAATTEYIPAPGIFLAGAIVAALALVLVPILVKLVKKQKQEKEHAVENEV